MIEMCYFCEGSYASLMLSLEKLKVEHTPQTMVFFNAFSVFMNEKLWPLLQYHWNLKVTKYSLTEVSTCVRVVCVFQLITASEKGVLWTENFQIWGLVNWKFLNLGACELKISKFGGLLAKIWAKIPNFFSKGGGLVNWLLLEMGPLWTTGEALKGGLHCCTPPYPLSRSVLPRGDELKILGNFSTPPLGSFLCLHPHSGGRHYVFYLALCVCLHPGACMRVCVLIDPPIIEEQFGPQNEHNLPFS